MKVISDKSLDCNFFLFVNNHIFGVEGSYEYSGTYFIREFRTNDKSSGSPCSVWVSIVNKDKGETSLGPEVDVNVGGVPNGSFFSYRDLLAGESRRTVFL